MENTEPRVIQFDCQPVVKMNPITRNPEQGEMFTVLRDDGRMFRRFSVSIPPYGTNWFELLGPDENAVIDPIAEEPIEDAESEEEGVSPIQHLFVPGE